MSSEKVTKLRSILDSITNTQQLVSAIMPEPNTAETESVADSSVSSQIPEIEDIYE